MSDEEWISVRDRWLSPLLVAAEEIVELHMQDMLSFGEPISRYYRKYQQQQRIGVHGLLTEAVQQLFAEEGEYTVYLQALPRKSYKWGERWAKEEIPKEVLLEAMHNLRHHAYEGIRRACTEALAREELLSRLHDVLSVRYHHTMRGYLASKDQKISHLHQQKMGVIGQMAAGMAHEIRNPLTAIRGFLQLMRKSLELEAPSPADRERFAKYIQICQHEVQTLDKLVTSFLILARKNEAANSRNEIVELHPLLERVHELTMHSLIEKDVHLSFHYSPEQVRVWAIPSHVEQICLNLMQNAIDAVDTNGIVRIHTRFFASESTVSVTIEDNGCGISEQRKKHLFEPFYTTKEKGTGIGLSICKKLVEEMGGQIEIYSTEGQGTRVELRLSAVVPAEPACLAR
ncbi:sensor histidine kinase [Brevibacillus agri]|uniref:sensor histidine kinase n=1 Tax=Brevibacillus agri TaxID=51101 RepID=UPI00046EF93E|nr:HAMP domain-containing sensor histidine kinase [Brevibacillus agri]